MTTEVDEVTINGVQYTRKDMAVQAEKMDGLPYVIVRTYSAGVFAGYLKERDGNEATILKARRLWYWSGASSLSQLAVDGVKNPGECKFPCEVSKIEVTEVIEVLQVTETARKNIAQVPIWAQ
jgi:hypothetical protein